MPTSRVILVLYTFAATANVMASARGPASLDWATTPLLLPLMIAVVVAAAHEQGRRPNALLITALAVLGLANVAGELTGGLPVWATAAYTAGQVLVVSGWIARRDPGRVGAA